MHCTFRRDPAGRVTAIICGGRGRKPQPKTCVGCKRKTALRECDGYSHRGPSDTCDNPVCDTCTTSIPNLDLDACPSCVGSLTQDGCAVARSYRDVGETPRHACAGATMYPQMICLRHLRLWGRWLLDGGWDEVYARQDIEREEKRRRFREWLAQQPEDAAA